jgi:hypothetical protein
VTGVAGEISGSTTPESTAIPGLFSWYEYTIDVLRNYERKSLRW